MKYQTQRKAVDLNTKIRIINAVEKDKVTVKNILLQFKVKKSHVYNILKYKESLKSDWLAGSGVRRKRIRKTENEDINTLVFKWFVRARSRCLPVSGPILQKYARKTAKKLGKPNFAASNGWLESFRRNHNLNFNETSGSEGSQNFLTPEELISSWSEKSATLIEGYGEKDIKVSEKTSLDYHTVPGKPLSLKKELIL